LKDWESNFRHPIPEANPGRLVANQGSGTESTKPTPHPEGFLIGLSKYFQILLSFPFGCRSLLLVCNGGLDSFCYQNDYQSLHDYATAQIGGINQGKYRVASDVEN
jgi:hypothetical protein